MSDDGRGEGMMRADMFTERGSRPVPDPTALTDAAIERLRKELTLYIDGEVKVLVQRLNGVDKATELRRLEIVQMPDEVRAEVHHLRELVAARLDGQEAEAREKTLSVAQQFAERDERGSLLKKASDDALAAALQAAKELVGVQAQGASEAATKAETSFTKQVDQIGVQILTGQAALDARITELKERIDRGEGLESGKREQNVATRDERGDSRSDAQLAQQAQQIRTALTVSAITIIIAVIGTATAILVALGK